LNSLKKDENTGKHYASSSLAWHVNALLALKDYELAEKLLLTKIAETERDYLTYNPGAIYEQLAEVQMNKGNYQDALKYLNQSYLSERREGRHVNCKAILGNIGYDVYYKHFKDADKALAYCRQAINYDNRSKSNGVADSLESLHILNRIANLYAYKGFYDSAFTYYRLAFDRIKPKIDERQLLNRSLDEFVRQKAGIPVFVAYR
jgi:tetratricopeptide (TPR) repeat protein